MKNDESPATSGIGASLRSAINKLTSFGSASSRKVFSPKGGVPINGRADGRGYKSGGRPINNFDFIDIEFSFASFAASRIENCRFTNCRFVNADFSDFRDHGNWFEDCEFVNAKFNGSAIGFRGTAFVDCRFEKCSFTGAIFSRPEFTGVEFRDCRIKNVDFDGASFEDCRFAGKLDDVWFRGGFAVKADEATFGVPRPNGMLRVSFEEAELRNLTFSDHCDLSNVTLPFAGEYFLFKHWKKRLERLAAESETWQVEEARKEASIFAKVHLVHAAKQDQYIINASEVASEHGETAAAQILASLRAEVH